MILNKIILFLRNHLREKWRFTYFELELNNAVFDLPPIDDSLVLREATRGDIPRFEKDIYPHLSQGEQNDHRYISEIGNDEFICYIGEYNNRIVHYFLVYKSALNSPLTKTPLYRSQIKQGDAYLGSTFTVPEVRGLWIVPHSIASIIKSLQQIKTVKRVLVLVHHDTPGAIEFYKRMGFTEMKNAAPVSLVSSLIHSQA